MTTTLSPRARRHTSATAALARTMYANGTAWNCSEIARYLTEQTGDRVDQVTVRMWVDDDYREARNARRRERRRTMNAGRKATATPVLNRMAELRAAGLSFTGIAAVLAIDEGLRLDEGMVRYYLRMGREPRLPKLKREAEVATASGAAVR